MLLPNLRRTQLVQNTTDLRTSCGRLGLLICSPNIFSYSSQFLNVMFAFYQQVIHSLWITYSCCYVNPVCCSDSPGHKNSLFAQILMEPADDSLLSLNAVAGPAATRKTMVRPKKDDHLHLAAEPAQRCKELLRLL